MGVCSSASACVQPLVWKAPFASEFMSKLSHCVGPLIFDSGFFVLSRSCDCLQTCFSSSSSLSLFLSLFGLDAHQSRDGLSHPLFVSLPPTPFFFFCCTYVHAMSIIRTFPSSSITPAASSTHGLERFPLCGLFIPPKVESTPVS